MRLSTFAVTVSAGLLVASSAWADPPSAASPATPVAPAQPAVAPETPAAPPTAAAENEEERSANNAIYLEGLGPGLFYSVDYDRRFGDFAARVGFGYVGISATATSANGTSGASASASFITVPLTVSYLGIGSQRHALELGAGATIVHVGAGGSTFNSNSSESASGGLTTAWPVAIVGYRFQPEHGGFFLKAGISPLIGGAIVVLPLPYLALGGTF